MIVNTYEDSNPRKCVVHFNRIAMQRGDDHVWTVHTSKACFNVKAVEIFAHMTTQYDPKGRQPRAKFVGRARLVINGGTAYLFAA
jgi:hypothetical protein